MFEKMLGLEDQNQKESNVENKLLDKQLKANKDSETAALAADANTDQTYNDFQEKRADLIRWQQELDEDLFELMLSLLSLKADAEGKITPIRDLNGKPIPPLCNNIFIHQVVMPILKPFASKNLINSNYDTKRILDKLRNTSDDITDLMSDNYDQYGIDFVNFNGILRDMKNFMEDSCWRSLKGWTKKTDSSMIKRIEQERFGEEEQASKKGLFSYAKT